MRPGDLLEQRYRLVRVLGRGRSGSVWCARNELIDRSVAIKILHRSLASDPERLQRFFQEARACGRVRHPAVVEVLDLGQGDDGVLFLVMELLEGETLSSLLARKGRLQTDEALTIVIPLARGLAAAHSHGILHRDLKPANIYLHKTPTGGLQPKILDFGISKILGSDLTQSGVVLGTPSYMSPEQARGVADLDPRMDVWSLGVILYELLTGRLPFLAREYRSLVEEILDKKHTPVAELATDVPIELARIVDEALEKSRERRLSSAASMAQKLTAVLRARGKADALREPEDEFSDGAPTLAQDRDRDFGKPSIDDTVGDHNKLAPVMLPEAQPAVAAAKPAPARTTSPGPSPQTAAIAAQTSGAKRIEPIVAPRPAAGTPARASRPGGERSERKTDPPPRRVNTQGWEVNAGRAASGRDELSTIEPRPIAEEAAAWAAGSGLPPSASKIRVDDNWDTTVADVSRDAMVASGAAPEAANASLPKLVASPSIKPQEAAALGGASQSAQPSASPSMPSPPASASPTTSTTLPGSPARAPSGGSIGAIPGFTAAPSQNASLKKGKTVPPPALPAPPPRTTSKPASLPPPPVKRGSRPPPPPPLSASPPSVHPASSSLAPQMMEGPRHKTKPPRPPPKTIPPGGNRSTLRPPADGFAAPRASLAPPRDAPLIMQDMFAEQAPEAAPLDLLGQAPPPQPAQREPFNDVDGAVAPAVTSSPNAPSSGFEDTARRRRAVGPPIVPFTAAMVAVLFIIGAIVGTVAANSRSDHAVRRFADAEAVLVAWHSRDLRLRDDEQTARDKSDAEVKANADAADAKAKADAVAKAKADADAKAADDAAAAASASASASAAASASASIKPPATKPAWKPPAPGWKPPATKPSATTKPTTTKPKPATTSTGGKGEKEWWKKKF